MYIIDRSFLNLKDNRTRGWWCVLRIVSLSPLTSLLGYSCISMTPYKQTWTRESKKRNRETTCMPLPGLQIFCWLVVRVVSPSFILCFKGKEKIWSIHKYSKPMPLTIFLWRASSTSWSSQGERWIVSSHPTWSCRVSLPGIHCPATQVPIFEDLNRQIILRRKTQPLSWHSHGKLWPLVDPRPGGPLPVDHLIEFLNANFLSTWKL